MPFAPLHFRRASFVPALWQTLCGVMLIGSVRPAHALIKFDEGHDEIFVTGTAGFTYDSNIFATSEGSGDTSFNASLLLEYKRKAGMLGVDASLGWNFSKYAKFSSENFADPQFNAEITKDSGRTTGTLKINAKKENRADTAINIRTESWDYGADLSLKYPVIERYSFSGDFAVDRRQFIDNPELVNIDTYTAGADLNYALTSERDLIAGYRLRETNTSVDTTDLDHAFTVGVSGKIISKFTGTARLGIQRRTTSRRLGPDESHNSLTASLNSTWAITSRLGLTAEAARDFSTVATDASVETSTIGLTAQYSVNAKTSAFAGVNYGRLYFIDTNAAGRRDDFLNLTAGVSYVFSDRLKLTASYSYTQNWSTFVLSNFDRHSVSLSVSSRW